MGGFILLIFSVLVVSTVTTAITRDTITFGQSVRDGETIVSAGEGFELGFFSPGKSKSRYVGIWYKKVSTGTITWVANRDAPISDHSGVLNITQQELVLLNSSNYTVWSSNVSRTAKNPIAVLLESGNLVVKDENDDNNPDGFLWQSFDHLCDTLLPGMKLGVNLVTGLNRFLSSWKSLDDPAEGEFKSMIDPHGVPQLVLRKGSEILLRAGSWNGLRWTGVPQLEPNPVYTFEFVWNANETFYRFNIKNSSVLSRMVLDPSGVVHRLTWVERTKSWESFSRFSGVTLDQCEKYALCGPDASCGFKMNAPVCECLEGFIPKFPDEWNFSDWSDGCARRTKLGCDNGDGFLKHKSVKLPDTRNAWADKNIGLSECKKICLKNCSCTAYANSDIRAGGNGCLLWFGELIDIRELTDIGQDLYIRLASSEIGCSARDTLDAKQSLKDGETLVSAEGNFEMGFFNPGKSEKRYLGIWYKKIATGTVVWVANRNNPLNDSSGVLKFLDEGNLALVNSTNDTIWSSKLSRSATNPVARLLDTGNLVVVDVNDDNPENFLWQSFDYPGNTFLAGMKAGIDFRTGLKKDLTSWKSPDDPSAGEYSNRLDPGGVPQLLLWKGSVLRFRSGPWNGLRFSGMPNLKPNPIYTFEFVFNDEEIYYKYELVNSSVVTRMELTSDGALQRYIWVDRTKEWNLYVDASMDDCDRYALCGAHGSCNINNSPACGCLEGFEPKFPEEWVAADWSHGCVRKVSLDCSEGEDFLKYSGIKVPDTQQSWYNKTMKLEECKKVCLKNCSCTAYANMDISGGGSGCILWFNELLDIRQYNENGQDIYIRLAASEIAAYRNSKGKERIMKIFIPLLCFVIILLGLFMIFIILKKMAKFKRKGSLGAFVLNQEHDFTEEGETEDLELPLFDFATLTDATGHFSLNNMLGQGGFGSVYKGKLKDGQEIAVKRLSQTSRQGIDEFKNEVSCIVKLQHRNLVKLLGCCIQAEERLLIYEYMPNKSLNFFIFDQNRSKVLDWPKRFNIINGIARGLLYLHQDSRLRIIHRDLKASNILLDHNMNPKISDFGLARSFGGDETAANTNKVVGTYGYMSPEYTIDGLFSTKSDVYSFGVLVLEIVSGKRNRGFTHSDHNLNLLGHAWRLFNEGRSIELINKSVKELWNISEVLRSIHVGLLCVQQSPEDRPGMSTVMLMLSSDIALAQPKKPGFYLERSLTEGDSSTGKQDLSSTNEVTVTLLEPR